VTTLKSGSMALWLTVTVAIWIQYIFRGPNIYFLQHTGKVYEYHRQNFTYRIIKYEFTVPY
jgi:hypothetical protein